ncbi:MAG: metallophosphoesterase [Clostridia bacterium]|nr:metallophosphoesterase [Clostridia bacterium]
MIVFAVYFIEGYISNHCLTVSSYETEYEQLPEEFDGFTIVNVADLHNALFGEGNSQLLEQIDKAQPDIVVLGGDMMSYGTVNFKRVFLLMEKLAEKYEVYYIFGNHEQNIRVANMLYVIQEAERMGINVMLNDSVAIERNGEKIMLHGLCQYKKSYRDPYYREPSYYEFSLEEMNEMLGSASDEYVDVLLAHNPLYFDIYSEWGADLVLSGHIHGGLWRIPVIDKGLVSPNEEIFPEYDAGEYIKNQAHLIVSRGLGGGSVIKPRLFNRPDLVVVTLTSGNPSN